MLEPVAQRFGEVACRDVLHRVLRGDHPEAGRRAHLADVRHADPTLVERGQEHILDRLGHPVELVDEQDRAAAHRLHEGPRAEALLAVPGLEDQRRIEPAGEARLAVAVVAVHPHRVRAQPAADRERQRRLAHADGPLEQQVAAGLEDRQGEGELRLAADDAVLALDPGKGGHGCGHPSNRLRPREGADPPAGRSAPPGGASPCGPAPPTDDAARVASGLIAPFTLDHPVCVVIGGSVARSTDPARGPRPSYSEPSTGPGSGSWAAAGRSGRPSCGDVPIRPTWW